MAVAFGSEVLMRRRGLSLSVEDRPAGSLTIEPQQLFKVFGTSAQASGVAVMAPIRITCDAWTGVYPAKHLSPYDLGTPITRLHCQGLRQPCRRAWFSGTSN